MIFHFPGKLNSVSGSKALSSLFFLGVEAGLYPDDQSNEGQRVTNSEHRRTPEWYYKSVWRGDTSDRSKRHAIEGLQASRTVRKYDNHCLRKCRGMTLKIA